VQALAGYGTLASRGKLIEQFTVKSGKLCDTLLVPTPDVMSAV
jgi:hypothetical protein